MTASSWSTTARPTPALRQTAPAALSGYLTSSRTPRHRRRTSHPPAEVAGPASWDHKCFPRTRQRPGLYRPGDAGSGLTRRGDGRRRGTRGVGGQRPGLARGTATGDDHRDTGRSGGLWPSTGRHPRRGCPGLRGGASRVRWSDADGPLGYPAITTRRRGGRATPLRQVLRRGPDPVLSTARSGQRLGQRGRGLCRRMAV